MTKQEFINLIKKGAIEGYKKYKILPSLIMSQAILESGWGKSHIEHNLFGIKATPSWDGKVAIRPTKEYVKGKWIVVNAKFRTYDSFAESLEDHAKLLGTLARYKNLIGEQDYKIACKKVWQDGYATDPNYPNKLIQIIEQNKLYEFDGDISNVLMTLKTGSRGNDVTELQNKLIKLGYKISADGIFGSKTENAVRQFQQTANIKVDGIVGRDTLKQIEISLNKINSKTLSKNDPNIIHMKY